MALIMLLSIPSCRCNINKEIWNRHSQEKRYRKIVIYRGEVLDHFLPEYAII